MVQSISICLFAIVTLFSIGVIANNVVDLDSKTFEHLTQASTGATTGDWFVKFYAPWCGHCRKMEGIWEEIATELKEEVNIARVDVPANRDLGNRFALKGFPTLIFFAKGHMYPYPSSSPRTKDALINFIRGGYKTATSETVPGPSSWFDDFTYIFRESYKSAKKDYDAGNYFTPNILIVLLPLMLLVTIYIIASNTPAKVKYDSPNLATMLFPNKEGSKQKAAKKSD